MIQKNYFLLERIGSKIPLKAHGQKLNEHKDPPVPEEYSNLKPVVWKEHIAVNCWHMNEFESAAMWKLYLKSDEGIAIQSTYADLRESFIEERSIFLGAIRYIDFNTERIDQDNIFLPFTYKRKSFDHEKEVRALVISWPPDGPIENGINIKVNLKILIQKIYVAPNSPHWFYDLVRKTILRYGYHFEIVQSQLYKSAIL